MYKRKMCLLIVVFFMMITTQSVYATTNTEKQINWIEGPKIVDVGDDLAKLNLTDEYIFANGHDAKRLMKEMGNYESGMEQGIVFSKDENQNWYVLFEFNPMGYVSDKESNKIDADKLLESIKKGTEEDNKKRREHGESTLDIIGWDEKPHYDSTTHNLTWSILANSGKEKIVNYNVRILGRGGVTEITLVANKSEMTKLQPELNKIISNYTYKEGKKYTDYIKGDKVAEIGLTALIAGGAGATAAKLGILGVIKKFLIGILLVLKKGIIVVVLAVGVFFKKLFKWIIGLFKKKPVDNESNDIETENDSLGNTIGENIVQVSEENK